MSDLLRRLQLRLGHHFNNPEFLNQALTHRSYASNHYERYEFVGDALLGSIIAEQLFLQFPQGREGQLTRLRASLVNKASLAELATELEIGSCLNLGGGELKSGGRQRPSILADVLEALICAIYLDSDFAHCRKIVLDWYSSRLAGLQISDQLKDPKTRLQEWLQKQKRPLPEYRLVEQPLADKAGIAGESDDESFRIKCTLSDSAAEATAQGSSRRMAEQVAAEKLLELLDAQG